MTYTGLFLLQGVDADVDGRTGSITALRSVKATCLNCQHLIEGSSAPHIETIKGGAILYCSECGTRQAITNAHFEHFLLTN